MRGYLAIALVLLLSGCATEPPKNPVPVQALAYQNRPSGEYATVTVVRDSGYMGSYCYVNFYIDGQIVAKLDTSQSITIYVPAGEHIFGGGPISSVACPLIGNSDREITVSLKGGEMKKYRLAFAGGSGEFSINPTAF
jgi:hypothetical protein